MRTFFAAVALAFFALCALYVQWCDRIIGPDVFAADEPADDAFDVIDEVAALSRSPATTTGSDCRWPCSAS